MTLSIFLYIDCIFNLCDCQEKKNGLHPTRKHVGFRRNFITYISDLYPIFKKSKIFTLNYKANWIFK